MHREKNSTRTPRPRRRRFAAGVALIAALAMAGVATVEAHGRGHRNVQRSDVMAQGGEEVYQHNGARLIRTDHSVEVQWVIRTPEPGSYTYPTPDMVPPGSPLHPPIQAGWPEVHTLWLFAFDHPEMCSDGVCDGNDVGDTPARGSVYQVDGEIADSRRLRMDGKVRFGQAAANGLGLSNPLGAEVHVAMAPHGMALEADDLVRQLNGPVGGPPLWLAAIFDTP